MSLKKCFPYSCALLMAGLLSVAPSSPTYSTTVQTGCQPVSCPPCFKNEPTLAGSGGADDGTGRRKLNVYIDSTWGSPPNTKLKDATIEAINKWNIAKDTTCAPHAGTGYFF